MKQTTYFHRRAKECRRYAIALAAMCGACAIGFAGVDGPSLTDVAAFLPLMLASAGFATGLGCVNELRESAWWRRMLELEAMAITPCDPHPAGRTKSFRYEEEGNADVPSAPRRPQVDTP